MGIQIHMPILFVLFLFLAVLRGQFQLTCAFTVDVKYWGTKGVVAMQPVSAGNFREKKSLSTFQRRNTISFTKLHQGKNSIADVVASISSTVLSSPKQSLIFSALMVFAGAALGPFLDSYHSLFNVLEYDTPTRIVLWGTNEHPALVTSWWVPALFGLAGWLIGWLYILGDAVEKRKPKVEPKPPTVLLGIAIFTFQYWLSGALYQSGLDRTTILNVMTVLAAVAFVLLDSTVSGLAVSTATAIGGPLIEVLLLLLARANLMLGAGYHYNDPGETGFFPLWILPVYFLGGPAVGNLARCLWNSLSETVKSESAVKSKETPGCAVCGDTRCVPCPNCDGVGTYVAMGGRVVHCTSCQGRGFVVCRACFDYYDEDPEDIESIRELMRGMPD